MQNADSFHEVRSILEGAERSRPRYALILLGFGALIILVAAIIAYTIIGLSAENSRLKAEFAREMIPSAQTATLLAEKQRLLQQTSALQNKLKELQILATRASETATRPMSLQQIFVLEELTRNAAWRDGRTQDATLAALLDELGVARLAEIKGDQWPIAIAYLIDARTNTNRRVYDPIGKGQ